MFTLFFRCTLIYVLLYFINIPFSYTNATIGTVVYLYLVLQCLPKISIP